MATDFGVAKTVSEATGAHKLTTEGVALGTPAYVSPEQAAADPHIDHRADIYAVGVYDAARIAGCSRHADALLRIQRDQRIDLDRAPGGD